MPDTPLRAHLLDDMQNAPFVLPEYASRIPVELVDRPDAAELIIGRKRAMFDQANPWTDKSYLLWTHEPFFDTTASWRVPDFFPQQVGDRDLYVFNVHNGLVYTDNFYLAPTRGKMRNINAESELNVPFENKAITFAATYKLSTCMVGKVDRSLNAKRCDLAMDLHARGRCRIIGRDWPDGYAEGESRFSNRPRAKSEFLKQSNFNLCYENCEADYYVTEKLWESIFAGCLPIYWSNGTIYQLFPHNSFIDGRDFDSTEALLAFVDNMSFAEYQRRINLCRRAFNIVVQENYRAASRERSLDRLNAFLRTISRSQSRARGKTAAGGPSLLELR